MRRLNGLVLPALLALVVLAAPAAAMADPVADVGDDVLILADEDVDMMEEEEEAQLGPDPMPREAEDNPARELGGYDDLDVPFTWGAAFLMLFLGVGGAALMAGLYWLLVHRPSKQ